MPKLVLSYGFINILSSSESTPREQDNAGASLNLLPKRIPKPKDSNFLSPGGSLIKLILDSSDKTDILSTSQLSSWLGKGDHEASTNCWND